MKTKLLVTAGLIAMMTGCGNQPQLDVNNVNGQSNEVKQESTTTNQDNISNKPVETSIEDKAVIKVNENSVPQNNLNQKLGALLSNKAIHFDFDKYNIREDQMQTLQEIAELLKNAQANFTIRIEGNCDEWGSDEYNYALGLKRAKTVKQALVDLGVDENKLTIISYGESNPVCATHTKHCWAKNRRDNFTLLP